ncbi:hypothetical protein BdWA1_000256 [Babesia duncani]|uniref:Uncharacterized protein n=1 Tax=Babesia duncani TaxID=323732 RepID=A0AAD9PLZ8_9APIC|nr:hypothetical protein BdWA1_000256 [Babesia duncani]
MINFSGEQATMVIEFDNDGTLKTSHGQQGGLGKSCMQSIGTWWANQGTVTMKIQSSQVPKGYVYLSAHVGFLHGYILQLSWNTLGECAFMQRGSIYEDRPPDSWLPQHIFRPVIGRFTACGIND